jgi:hypothetical protein
MTKDIKDFYLYTPMSRCEYMRIPLCFIPKAIIDTYNLHAISHNGNAYDEISKGMYGLPQAGKLANDDLIIHLSAQPIIITSVPTPLDSSNTTPDQFPFVLLLMILVLNMWERKTHYI